MSSIISTLVRDRTRASILLAFGLIAVVQSSLFPLHVPPYLDFDTATMVIFVNNVAERGDPGYFFDQSNVYEDAYRDDWSYQFLPVSVLGATIKTLLGIDAVNTAALLTVLSVLIGGLACLLAAAFVRVSGEEDWYVAGFTFAGGWLVPSFFLLGRSGVVSFMLYGALYWGALLLFALYCRTGLSRYLYGISAVLGVHLLGGYPTLYTLPIFFSAALIAQPMWKDRVRSWHVLISVALIPVIAAVIITTICLLMQVDLADYWRGSMDFYRARAGASVEADSTVAQRAWNFFCKQVLLDQTIIESRAENLWLHGTIVWSWVLILLAAAWGVVRAVRGRERTPRIVAGALLASLALCIGLLSPELRYMFALTPCYAYLAAHGLGGLGQRRRWVLLGLLMALAAESAYVARTTYSDSMKADWAHYAGQREAIELILVETTDPAEVILFDTAGFHERKYHDFLYILAYSDFRLMVPSHQPMLLALQDGSHRIDKIYVLADPRQPEQAVDLSERGYVYHADIIDRPTGRAYTLWLNTVGQ